MFESHHDKIIILDYGSQYSQLIARRIREANVYCELYSWRAASKIVMKRRPKGFILSGGPNSVYDEGAPTLPDYVLSSGLPILGICYGMQLLMHRLGGRVNPSPEREYGPSRLHVDDLNNPLFLEWRQKAAIIGTSGATLGIEQVWMSHGDRVEEIAPGFSCIAHSEHSQYAAIADLSKNYFAVQFHPEVIHSKQGQLLIANFVHRVCGCRPDWTPSSFIIDEINRLREQIGTGRVILGLSGGVDSAVAAALIHRAIGKQLTCIFVDHGLMRKDEALQVIDAFEKTYGLQLVAVNAVEEFMEALSGVTDPESKRRIIGELFIRIFEQEAGKLGQIDYLAQGTIYPDVIESAAKDKPEAETIKTHHNVGGLPVDMQFDLVEPLRKLFKDEVRVIGKELGLPEALLWRHPFPGPGLAIRCLGEVSWDRLERLREADAIFVQELAEANLLREATQQAFAVLLPVRSVGVMGDGRTYDEVVALRAVTTEDFMTGDWARLPVDLLARVSQRIVNEVQGINRVVYDITSKPPATIEWE